MNIELGKEYKLRNGMRLCISTMCAAITIYIVACTWMMVLEIRHYKPYPVCVTK